MTVRTAAVEDDSRYRASLEALLEHSGDFRLIASFASADDALAALRDRGVGEPRPWDLVLMDVDLPGTDGISATRALKALYPGIAVVTLTVFEESHTVLEAICAGADGYLVKRAPAGEILDELRVVMSGGAPLSAGVARTVLNLLRRQGGEAGRTVHHGSTSRSASRTCCARWCRAWRTSRPRTTSTSASIPCAATCGTSTPSCRCTAWPRR